MAITAASLTASRSGTNGTVYTTASVTPGANRLLLLTVYGMRNAAGALAAPTVAGNGLTWVNIALRTLAGSTDRGFAVYRAMGSAPSTGAITITWATTMNFCFWTLVEFDGVDTSGTNGSGAVRQIATADGNASTASITLAAFNDAVANAAYGYFAHHSGSEATTPEAGYTELSDQVESGYEAGRSIADEWRLAEDLAVTASWTSAVDWLGAAVEIQVAAAAGGHPTSQRFGQVPGARLGGPTFGRGW